MALLTGFQAVRGLVRLLGAGVCVALALGGVSRGEAATYTLTVLRDGSELLFQGPIEAGADRALAEVVLANPQIKVVHLASLGGVSDVARRMGEIIRQRGLDTHISGPCLSACGWVFLGGAQRFLHPTAASLGFQFSMDEVRSETFRQDFLRDGREAGVDRTFLETALGQALWQPSAQQAIDQRFATGLSSGQFSIRVLQNLSEDFALKLFFPSEKKLKNIDRSILIAIMSSFDFPSDDISESEYVVENSNKYIEKISNYIAFSSENLFDEIVSLNIVSTEFLLKNNPDYCINAIDAPRFFSLMAKNSSVMYPQDLLEISQDVMTAAMISGYKREGRPPNPAQVEKVLGMLGQRMRKHHGAQYYENFAKAIAAADGQAVCHSSLALFREIQKLTKAQKAIVIKSAFMALN